MKPSHIVRQDPAIAASIFRKQAVENIVDFLKSLTREEWTEYLKYLLSRSDSDIAHEDPAFRNSFKSDCPIAFRFEDTGKRNQLGSTLLATFSFSGFTESIGPKERATISGAISDLVSGHLMTCPNFVDVVVRQLQFFVDASDPEEATIGWFDFECLNSICNSPVTASDAKFRALHLFKFIPDKTQISEAIHELLLRYRKEFSDQDKLLQGVIYALMDFGFVIDVFETLKCVSIWPESYGFNKSLYSAIMEKGLKSTVLSEVNDNPTSFPEPIVTKLRDLIENGPKY
jgi:hypothetical protein